MATFFPPWLVVDQPATMPAGIGARRATLSFDSCKRKGGGGGGGGIAAPRTSVDARAELGALLADANRRLSANLRALARCGVHAPALLNAWEERREHHCLMLR